MNLPNRRCGWKKLPEWRVWYSMRRRCDYPKHKSYSQYGGRGITVCSQWQSSFESFYRDMGPRPTPRHQLDRIDNNGPYSPENCRWTTSKQQHRNCRPNLYIEFEGRKQILQDWAAEVGLGRVTIRGRLDSGWSIRDALFTPSRKRHRDRADK